MKTKKRNSVTDFSKFTNEELADAFIFPSRKSPTDEEKQEEEAFWQERRKQFENRSINPTSLSSLRGKIQTKMSNEDIDKQLNKLREE